MIRATILLASMLLAASAVQPWADQIDQADVDVMQPSDQFFAARASSGKWMCASNGSLRCDAPVVITKSSPATFPAHVKGSIKMYNPTGTKATVHLARGWQRYTGAVGAGSCSGFGLDNTPWTSTVTTSTSGVTIYAYACY